METLWAYKIKNIHFLQNLLCNRVLYHEGLIYQVLYKEMKITLGEITFLLFQTEFISQKCKYHEV